MLSKKLEKYRGKRVLVTGHTGFKGSWLTIWLKSLGAEVIGIALDPVHEKCVYMAAEVSEGITDYRGDIRDKDLLADILLKEQPEMIFHLAAQPLVLDSYQDPIYTYEVNVMGTAHLLQAIRFCDSVKTCVCITTDKVYKNKEWIWPYREHESLGGYDPYSASKAACELIVSSYRDSFFNPLDYDAHKKSIASVRAGNVIGGGDFAANRIIPDCINALFNNSVIELRKPKAVRPWQHVLEPLGGYLLLGTKMLEQPTKFCESYNFGPEAQNIRTVQDLAVELIKLNKKGEWKDISTPSDLHEASLLSLDINKVKNYLGWHPVLDFEETIAYTYDWYVKSENNKGQDLCLEQINRYMKLWKLRNEN